MKKITLIKYEDGSIWVTSDENEVGTESTFKEIKDEDQQMMIALADFLGYEPASVLCFDDEISIFNDHEKKLIDILNTAKGYVKGELELDCFDGEWFAMDYIEDREGAFPIEEWPYNRSVITAKEAKEKGIDVIKCCNECHIAYVG